MVTSHRVALAKLSRPTAHRMLMLRNMVSSLFQYDAIETTYPKAKAAARYAEKIITLAKRSQKSTVNRARWPLLDPTRTMPRLMHVVLPRYLSRPGGYTRIHRLGPRSGDSAPMAVLELVDSPKDLKHELVVRSAGRELAIAAARRAAGNSVTDGSPLSRGEQVDWKLAYEAEFGSDDEGQDGVVQTPRESVQKVKEMITDGEVLRSETRTALGKVLEPLPEREAKKAMSILEGYLPGQEEDDLPNSLIADALEPTEGQEGVIGRLRGMFRRTPIPSPESSAEPEYTPTLSSTPPPRPETPSAVAHFTRRSVHPIIVPSRQSLYARIAFHYRRNLLLGLIESEQPALHLAKLDATGRLSPHAPDLLRPARTVEIVKDLATDPKDEYAWKGRKQGVWSIKGLVEQRKNAAESGVDEWPGTTVRKGGVLTRAMGVKGNWKVNQGHGERQRWRGERFWDADKGLIGRAGRAAEREAARA